MFVVNAVMGVEVSTQRLWSRAAELGVARLIYVNMLDRERADFFRTLDSLKAAFGPHVVATEIPIGSEHEVRGLIDLVDMKAYEYSGTGRENCKEIPIPDDMADLAQEYREKLMDEVAENSDALMERYLEGEEISHEEIVTALKDGTDHGHIFPVTCGVATQHLGADRLLDAIVDDLPSPVQHGGLELEDMTLEPDRRARRSPTSSRRAPTRSPAASTSSASTRARSAHDTHLLNTRAHAKERIGQLLVPQGKEVSHTDAFGPGDIGAVAKLKETRAGDWLADRDQPISMPSIALPGAGHGVRDRAEGEGRRGQGLHRAAPPPGGGPDDRPPPRRRDRRADRRRPVADPRRGRRRPPEVALRRRGRRSSRRACPTRRRSAGSAKAHGRHKKQSGGRGQFGDCHIEIEPLADGDVRVRQRDQGRRHPDELHPGGGEGRASRRWRQGVIAGYPLKGVRVRLFDG